MGTLWFDSTARVSRCGMMGCGTVRQDSAWQGKARLSMDSKHGGASPPHGFVAWPGSVGRGGVWLG